MHTIFHWELEPFLQKLCERIQCPGEEPYSLGILHRAKSRWTIPWSAWPRLENSSISQRTAVPALHPLGPLGFDFAQHGQTLRPSVNGIRSKALRPFGLQ